MLSDKMPVSSAYHLGMACLELENLTIREMLTYQLVRLNFNSSNVISFWGIRARVLIKSLTIEELNVNFTDVSAGKANI